MADPDGARGATTGDTADDAAGATAGDTAGGGSILFVCTANRIRSPFAAAVARRIVAEHELSLTVSSAGLDPGGLAAMDQMVGVAERFDIDLSGHESRQVTRELVDASDLVIAMTGAHVIDLAGAHPDAVNRVATLREAAAAASAELGPPRWKPPAMRAWAARVTQRPLEVLLGGEVDVADPVGRSKRIHRRTATLINELTEQFLVPHTET